MRNKRLVIKFLNGLFFLFILCLTLYFVFKKNDINLILNNIKDINVFYVIISIVLMFIFISFEGINIRKVLNTLGDKVSFLASYKYACVGFFFSAITPSASGGDPMQLYFMKKDSLPLSHSALALLVELSSFQFVSCIMAVLGFIFNYNILFHRIGNIKYLMFLGIFINVIYLSFLIIMIFSKKVTLKLLNVLIRILKFFRYKKIDAFYKKALLQVDDYHNCSIYLKNNKKLLLKIVLTTFLELLIYHSIPYFVYLAFGLSEYSIFKFIFLEAVLYTTVSCLPFPGAMGVSEGSFVILFKMLFPASILGSAMVLTRAISYYLFVVITGVLILIFMAVRKLKCKKESV